MKKYQRLIHSHSPQEIAKRLAKGPEQSYLRDFIYGGIDGGITTFSLIAGVVGANLSSSTILILGMANILADGFSMAASNYLGTRSECEELNFVREFERSQIEQDPEGEKEEVKQILLRKGIPEEFVRGIVKYFLKDKEKWVQLMITEEYGLPLSIRSPFLAGLFTFLAFIVSGFIPLLPFLFKLNDSFLLSSFLTCLSFFLIGSLKSRWSLSPWWKEGGKTFLLGGLCACLAYLVGRMLKDFAH